MNSNLARAAGERTRGVDGSGEAEGKTMRSGRVVVVSVIVSAVESTATLSATAPLCRAK